jgi:predicted DNA-binding transcriptional regulator AlpA
MDAAVECARAELPQAAYLNTPAAAVYLGVTRKQLEHWRSAGCGPRYSKFGRHVRYSRAGLDAWAAAREVTRIENPVKAGQGWHPRQDSNLRLPA